MYISVADYSQHTEHGGIPVQAHPDFSILSYHQIIVKEFRAEFQGKDPALVLMYSYYSTCNHCTGELIRMKSAVPDPKSTLII